VANACQLEKRKKRKEKKETDRDDHVPAHKMENELHILLQPQLLAQNHGQCRPNV
jgi:hypothetical protein